MRSEISALLDDELAPESAGRTIEALRLDPGLRDAWDTYHLIGDALRRSPELSSDFSEKVMTRLARGPTVFAPAAATYRAPQRSRLRFVLPLAASMMGMGAVAWVAMSLNTPQSVQVVAAPAVAPGHTVAAPVAAASVTPAPAPASPANGALKEYLVAHQIYSPIGGIQGVAPYARTVSGIRQGGGQ